MLWLAQEVTQEGQEGLQGRYGRGLYPHEILGLLPSPSRNELYQCRTYRDTCLLLSHEYGIWNWDFNLICLSNSYRWQPIQCLSPSGTTSKSIGRPSSFTGGNSRARCSIYYRNLDIDIEGSSLEILKLKIHDILVRIFVFSFFL